MKNEVYSILKKLAETPSPSGYEDAIRGIIREELEGYVDEIRVDAMGNLIAVKKGAGEGKIMIAAHMDEIALMVKHIDKRGFLRLAPIGGWSDIILPGQRLQILTIKGEIIKGVVGSKPPHIMRPEEAKQVIPLRNLFVDIGVNSREEAEKLGVKVGCVAVIDRDVAPLAGERVTGRAFDNKVGVTVMIETVKQLEKPPVDVYAVATVQEEVGLKGARTSAYAINPDAGIALDTTIASDIPGVSEDNWITQLGKGPAIKVMDGRSGSGIITDPRIREKLIKIAEEKKIPYQLEILTGGTTDAAIIQLTRAGVPTGAISIPTRYIHSPIETLDLDDVENAVKLLSGFIMSIDMKWLKILGTR